MPTKTASMSAYLQMAPRISPNQNVLTTPPVDNGVPPGPDKAGFTLIFADEMDGVTKTYELVAAVGSKYVDRSLWTTRLPNGDFSIDRYRHQYVDELYRDPSLAFEDTINPFVFSGSLLRMKFGVIPAELRPAYRAGDYRKFYSGALCSFPNTLMKYGVWEMRARMPTVRGAISSFWLLSDADAMQWPPQIDVFEYFAVIDTGALHTGVFGRETPPYFEPDTGYDLPSQNPDRDFHVYTVETNSANVIFFIDNVEYWRTPTLASLTRGNLFALITTAISGDRYAQLNANYQNKASPDWEVDEASMPGEWLIDWFRVYERA